MALGIVLWCSVGLLSATGPSPSLVAPTAAATRLQRPLLVQQRRSHAPAMMAAAAVSGDKPSGASVSSTVVNLAKNIVGSGVLALAAGVAAFSSQQVAVVPALGLMLFMCAVSAYTFSLIARVSALVGASSYRDAWAKVFGEKSAILPATIVVFKTSVGALSYAIILGESAASMASLAGAPSFLRSSNAWIGLISSFLLLPLCLMRDLSSLAFGSILGTAGTIYTALFMWFRYFEKSYAVGGKFFAAMPVAAQPAFAAAGSAPLFNLNIFVLISMLATTFLAHYNAPKFYDELAAPAGEKLKKFNLAVGGGFGLAAVLCGAIMSVGFLTFGGSAQGLILNSYATADPLAFLARLGIGLSVLFSYPLLFLGLRQGVLQLLKLDGMSNKVHRISTIAIMAAINGAALFVKDLGLVTALGGAILGSVLVYIMPALMHLTSSSKARKASGKKQGALDKADTAASYGTILLGIVLAILGAGTTLRGAGGH